MSYMKRCSGAFTEDGRYQARWIVSWITAFGSLQCAHLPQLKRENRKCPQSDNAWVCCRTPSAGPPFIDLEIMQACFWRFKASEVSLMGQGRVAQTTIFPKKKIINLKTGGRWCTPKLMQHVLPLSTISVPSPTQTGTARVVHQSPR